MLSKKFKQLEEDFDALSDSERKEIETKAETRNLNVFLDENPKVKALLIALIEFFIWLPFTRAGVDFGLRMLLLAITGSQEYKNKN